MSFNQTIYDQAIANGASPIFADMLAHQQPPGTKGTDRAFLEGKLNNNDIGEMPGWMQQRFKEQIKQSGENVTGKVYVSALARKKRDVQPGETWGPGDTYAYVSDVSELRAKAQSLGLEGDGIIKTRAPDRPPTPDVPLAEDLVRNQMAMEIAKNPGLKKNLGELRHNVIEKHAPKWGKGATKNFLKKVSIRK